MLYSTIIRGGVCWTYHDMLILVFLQFDILIKSKFNVFWTMD